MLCDLFGWHVRWSGDAIDNGRTVHVGTDSHYVAIYTNPGTVKRELNSYTTNGALNHLGILVEDLEEAEQRVLSAGLTSFNHQDYEPGRRFYFKDHDEVEYEVVCYGAQQS